MSATIIQKYFPKLSLPQQQKFTNLEKIYTDWNWKLNLISRQDMGHLYERHVLHSLGIAKIITFEPETRILDVGTGGGFPGIPLAILFPEVHFFLVDSIGKKIKAVEDIAAALALENVTALHLRAEKVNGEFDFVVSRAVAPLRELFIWTKDKIRNSSQHDVKNGLLCLKGGALEEEVEELQRASFEFALSDYFEEEFFATKKVVHVPVE